MYSKDFIDENIAKLAELFPNCVTESTDDNGDLQKTIDFDLLRQELSNTIVEGPQERYRLDWPSKREALLTANAPIAKTLRPCREESIDFDTTENLFIEGDNLDALKLLQETYLGKVKMIYIDPPYNTGKDFIYNDRFTIENEQWKRESGDYDEEGNRLVVNTESNGRFHSDWLSMMYPRLKLARNLLKDDGVIFISIDDNEQANLKRICDEIFGEENFVSDFSRKTKSVTNVEKTGINIQHESCLMYTKNKNLISMKGEKKDLSMYSNPDDDPRGTWIITDPSAPRDGDRYPIINPYTGRKDYPPKGRAWFFSKENYHKMKDSGQIKFKTSHKGNERGFILKRYLSDIKNHNYMIDSLSFIDNKYLNQVGTKELIKLFQDKFFDMPKPVEYIKKLSSYATNNDDIIFDFFAGSSTTAHAVMQLNAEEIKSGGGGSESSSWFNFPNLVMRNLKHLRQAIRLLQILAKSVSVGLERKSRKIIKTMPMLKILTLDSVYSKSTLLI